MLEQKQTSKVHRLQRGINSYHQGHNHFSYRWMLTTTSPYCSCTNTGKMEAFCKYSADLQTFNYPNIESFSDQQIIDIFSVENRSFLLTWLAKILNSQFIVPTDWSKLSQATFADFFHESGFCSSSQKIPFVTGSAKVKEQVQIFDRIFYFLKKTVKSDDDKESSENMNNSNSSNDDLKPFLSKDINVFPEFGPLKLYHTNIRKLKLEQYREKIHELQEKIKTFEKPTSGNVVFDKSYMYEEEHVDRNIEKFAEQAKKLEEVCSSIRKADKENVAAEVIGFEPGFGEQLADCKAEIAAVLQYFQDLSISESLSGEQQYDWKPLQGVNMPNILKEHSQTTAEIIKLMKNLNNS